jgi:DNA polymerase-3 subunit alpha
MPDGSRGVKVLPPDVNVSDKDFTPVTVDGAAVIRFGMMAVRGVGEKAVEAIIEQRKDKGDFASLYEFCERVDLRQVTRSTIEALVKCGAFSSLKARRAQLLEILERAVEMGQQAQNDKRSGQLNMFGQAEASATSLAPSRMKDVLPDVPELSGADLLKFEKELLGFYITSHPLAEHQNLMERYTTASTREAMNVSEGTEVLIGGMLSAVRAKVAKTGRSAGQRWAILELEDLEGKIEGMCFAEAFADISARWPGVLSNERIVFMRGKVDKRRETPCLMVTDVIPIEAAIEKLTTSFGVKVNREANLSALKDVVKKHAGKKEWFVQVVAGDGSKVSLKVNGEMGVRVSRDLVDELERLLGSGAVQLGGDGQRRMKRLEQQRLFKEQPIAVDAPLETPADMDMELVADSVSE